MPVNPKTFAVKFAVLVFFIMAAVGCFNSLPTDVCAKRALIGAVAAYIVGKFAANSYNSIMIRAIVQKRINQFRGDSDDITN